MAKVGSLRKVLGRHFALAAATAVLSGGTMFSITAQRGHSGVTQTGGRYRGPATRPGAFRSVGASGRRR